MGIAAQPGQDLAREDRWVGPLAFPRAYGRLVRGVLAPANFGGSAAVGGVALFSA